AARQLRPPQVLPALRVLDVPGATGAPAPRQLTVPGLLRWRRLHDRQGQVDPRPRPDGGRRLPRRQPGRGAPGSAHLGRPLTHSAIGRGGAPGWPPTPPTLRAPAEPW